MIIPQIKFVFDRKHTASADKKGTIDIRITFDRKQKFVATGVKCYPGEWDAVHECVKSLDAQQDNINLMIIRKKALKVIGDMVEANNIDISAIPALLKQRGVDITFEDYVYQRISKKQVSDNTKKAYRVFYSKFLEWGKMKFFSDINARNIRAWDEYLHAYRWTEKDRFGRVVEKSYSQASIGSMHKNLKVFIGDAVVDGYVKENPYSTKRIKIDKGEARTESFLTVEEMDKIENANMPTRSLTEARDLFVFACKTGMSYADLMEFDYSKVIEIDGFKLYRSKRHKTLTSFSSVIIKSAMSILEKYNFSLPKMPNQKYNIKLKLVADAAGIDKPISSHWARRSAAMFWLNEGVPLDVVSKILGHNNQKQTLEYAHILDKTIIKEIAKVVDD